MQFSCLQHENVNINNDTKKGTEMRKKIYKNKMIRKQTLTLKFE